MKYILTILTLVSVFSFSPQCMPNPLTLERLKGFSEQMELLNDKSKAEFYPYLADNIVLEMQIGNNVKGVTLFYDKADMIKAIFDKEHIALTDNAEYDTYNHKLISPTQGEFTVIGYIKQINHKFWVTYFVRQQHADIKIEKIIIYIS